MKSFSISHIAQQIQTALAGCLLLVVFLPATVVAQVDSGEKKLAEQLRDLQTKVDKLEAELKKSSKMQGKSMPGMGMKKGMGMSPTAGKEMMSEKKKMMSGMGMSDKKKMGMSGMGMSGMGMSGMGMSGMGMSGMAMMGKVKGTDKMQVPSALPGFAGASHIYHIGATSFFLDHSEHITLTQEQQLKLNQIKEKTLLEQATFERTIAQAEQELWVLTGSDKPDAAKIEAKIRDIEKQSGEKRIAFVRAVGEAAQVLTGEQRKALVGTLPADHDDAGTQNPN